jgi:hypothetical protein
MQTSISVWVKHWGFTMNHSDDVKMEAEILIEVNRKIEGQENKVSYRPDYTHSMGFEL